ncbi:MAG TPA: hypothetical protein PKK15_06205 [Kouleothrix sp.]|mgnify:CR=1 FL=1|nr:hypothetical protein [Kouleothrix sp.]
MRLRWFAIGALLGLLLAPASGRDTWRRLRDGLARAIDAGLRIGT